MKPNSGFTPFTPRIRRILDRRARGPFVEIDIVAPPSNFEKAILKELAKHRYLGIKSLAAKFPNSTVAEIKTAIWRLLFAGKVVWISKRRIKAKVS